MTAVAALQFHSVFKNFPDRRGGRLEVLQNITFDVLDREVVAVLGPSGCGKSTLLHIAAGLSAPDRGSISLFGNALGATSGIGYRLRRASDLYQTDQVFAWTLVRVAMMLLVETAAIRPLERHLFRWRRPVARSDGSP